MLTRSDGLVLSYDGRDFTASITPPGGSAISMGYTGTDQTQRIQKGATTYKYDDKGIGPIMETGGSTTYFTTTPSGTLVDLRQGSNRYYYVFDGLGSVVGLTDSAGVLVNGYSYDPYGNILSQTEAVSQPYKFAGVYYDSETGLYKMGARYSDPTTGRFTQVDSVKTTEGLPTKFNLYIYSGNDPINKTDLTGNKWSWANFTHALKTTFYAVVSGASFSMMCLTIAVGVVFIPETFGLSAFAAAGFAIEWYDIFSWSYNEYLQDIRERGLVPQSDKYLPEQPIIPNPLK